ncbi:MAG TPA: class I SAM-dependent methyltransferase, partial [Candidatus Saccharimonadales bacterium]|nr:class I SAM-dependent methyltransferase [Candidatus Saccharimonadales bacterium]
LQGRVLDLCGGTGWLGRRLPRACEYVYVDASEEMHVHAHNLNYDAIRDNRARVIQYDVHNLLRAVKPRSVDSAVMLFGSLSYCRPAVIAAELMAVLRPGGRFFVTAYGPRYWRRPSYFWNRPGMPGGSASPHWGLHDPAVLRRAFYGFTDLRVEGLVSPAADRLLGGSPRLVARAGLEVDRLLGGDDWYYWCLSGAKETQAQEASRLGYYGYVDVEAFRAKNVSGTVAREGMAVAIDFDRDGNPVITPYADHVEPLPYNPTEV